MRIYLTIIVNPLTCLMYIVERHGFFVQLARAAAASLYFLATSAYAASSDIESAVSRLLQELPDSLAQRDIASVQPALVAVYANRGYRPLWFTADGLTQQAQRLLQAMSAAGEAGLNPVDYETVKLFDEARTAAVAGAMDREAQLDVAISASALKFIAHLHYGRVDPMAAGFDMPARSDAFDTTATLERIARTDDIQEILAAVEPQFQHYTLLKHALTRYRQLALRPGLSQIVDKIVDIRGVTIKPGDFYEGAPALRRLLSAFGDLSVENDIEISESTLDERLADALKRFQFRHGLKQDGALGRETYAALTVPMAMRVKQIELTLERWRWLPALEGPTIIVNIPQFRLFAFASKEDRESQMLTMDVIVGKAFPRPLTPVFAADMKYVVFRPYWDVPMGIVATEMLPHIRINPAYLAANDLEIVDSENGRAVGVDPTPENIAALAAGQLRLRQRPGADNALGLVKFVLPNKYGVYLHSTPARKLFERSNRAFSHGCIRVSDPVALAEYVLKNAVATEWTRERIEEAMTGPPNSVRVDLKQAVGVLIVYGTAVATESRGVYFFEDIYGNDTRLARLLARKSQR